MGCETGIGNECPVCEGALLIPITDVMDKCPRCGYERYG